MYEKTTRVGCRLHTSIVLYRKRCYDQLTGALTLDDDDDRQECSLYTIPNMYVYTHRAQLFTVNYLLSVR